MRNECDIKINGAFEVWATIIYELKKKQVQNTQDTASVSCVFLAALQPWCNQTSYFLTSKRRDNVTTTSLYCFRFDGTTEELPPQDERKFIVFESALKQLLNSCRKYFAACKTASRVHGTLLEVQTLCANNHFLTRTSQPYINGKPAGNVLTSAAILFSGTSPTSVLRMFEHINLQAYTPRTFSTISEATFFLQLKR